MKSERLGTAEEYQLWYEYFRRSDFFEKACTRAYWLRGLPGGGLDASEEDIGDVEEAMSLQMDGKTSVQFDHFFWGYYSQLPFLACWFDEVLESRMGYAVLARLKERAPINPVRVVSDSWVSNWLRRKKKELGDGVGVDALIAEALDEERRERLDGQSLFLHVEPTAWYSRKELEEAFWTVVGSQREHQRKKMGGKVKNWVQFTRPSGIGRSKATVGNLEKWLKVYDAVEGLKRKNGERINWKSVWEVCPLTGEGVWDAASPKKYESHYKAAKRVIETVEAGYFPNIP